ncbi:MAG: hypothetical protein K6F81_04245 [Acholeplasmatales bacterium]|nr:hypothetical protein [Acholeplasmatales bacterium]
MIKTKEDLKYYLEQDRLNLKQKKKKPDSWDIIWKYEIALRKHEYYHNKEKKSLLDKVMLRHYAKKHKKMTFMYTTSIPINVCGPGLSIGHLGTIYVNSKSKIGKNLRIQSGVTIGGAAGKDGLPILGDNVYVGAGAKVIGPIRVADNVAIGSNAVVVKTIDEASTTWGGVPAKKISNNNSWAYIADEVLVKKEATD